MLEKKKECFKCIKKTENLKYCFNCRIASYCSKDCQINDWINHKKVCKKYCKKVSKNLVKYLKNLDCVKEITIKNKILRITSTTHIIEHDFDKFIPTNKILQNISLWKQARGCIKQVTLDCFTTNKDDERIFNSMGINLLDVCSF